MMAAASSFCLTSESFERFAPFARFGELMPRADALSVASTSFHQEPHGIAQSMLLGPRAYKGRDRSVCRMEDLFDGDAMPSLSASARAGLLRLLALRGALGRRR